MKGFLPAGLLAAVLLMLNAVVQLTQDDPPQPLPKAPEQKAVQKHGRGFKLPPKAVVQLTQDDPPQPLPKAPEQKAVQQHGRGFKLPPKAVRDAMHRISETKHGSIRKTIPVNTDAVYDARVKKVIPPVGNQNGCGDCYIWSGCKVCASAQMVAGVVPKDGKFMLAPSFFLDCQSVGGCDGGDEYQVAQLVSSGGAPSQAQYGGDGYTPGNCKSTSGMTLYTVSSIIMVSSQSGIAGTQDIKNYLATYGYVSVAGDASTSWWNNGTGTDTGSGTNIDHAIGLVGWDDTHDNGDGSKGAWIMQNNWDVSWGSNCANAVNPNPTEAGGYGWMKYGADSIGTEAFVCVATMQPSPPTPPVPPAPPVPGAGRIVSIVATFQDGSTQTLSGTPSSGITITATTTIADLIAAMQLQKIKEPK